jgi:glycosyltransferase involved in cell wall biosynthesis
MKLSIITINYNNAEGLRKTLDSVASQTFRDFEHIIVDGGSTDESVEIIRNYADEQAIRLKGYKAIRQENCNADNLTSLPIIWISEPDKGIYNAMNKGIRLANGEYLLFLNSGDCLVCESTLSNFVDCILMEDIIYGNNLQICSDGNMRKVKYDRYVTGKTLFNHTIPHQASFIKRSLFDSIGLYSEDLHFGSDWEFYLKALFYHNCSFRFVDIDVCLFDMTGISTDPNLTQEMLAERNFVLQRIIPQLYADYKEMNDCLRRVGMMDEMALRVGKKILKPYRIFKNLFLKK